MHGASSRAAVFVICSVSRLLDTGNILPRPGHMAASSALPPLDVILEAGEDSEVGAAKLSGAEAAAEPPVSPPTEPPILPRELRAPTHPLTTPSPTRPKNRRKYLDFFGTTYKAAYFAPPTPPSPPGPPELASASGYIANFPRAKPIFRRVATASGVTRPDTPRAPTGRRIRTAPAGIRRAQLTQIKELTGCQHMLHAWPKLCHAASSLHGALRPLSHACRAQTRRTSGPMYRRTCLTRTSARTPPHSRAGCPTSRSAPRRAA